jgi:hypothetical protein
MPSNSNNKLEAAAFVIPKFVIQFLPLLSGFGLRIFARVIRQFHHVISSPPDHSAHVQDVHLALVRARNRLELLDALEFRSYGRS